jgi:membrane peptidoglycan carboxypeptidase
MQLARNLFLHRKKTLSRKLQEIIIAWLLEGAFEKDELLALYLNVVEFGPEVFGIKDAAAHYFAKAPADLTPAEVAWMVRLLPGPRKYYPQFEKRKLTKSHTRSINRLLKLLVDRGHLDPVLATPIGPEDLWAGMEDLPLGKTIEEISPSAAPGDDANGPSAPLGPDAPARLTPTKAPSPAPAAP